MELGDVVKVRNAEPAIRYTSLQAINAATYIPLSVILNIHHPQSTLPGVMKMLNAALIMINGKIGFILFKMIPKGTFDKTPHIIRNIVAGTNIIKVSQIKSDAK